jgi:di/tricarboxylate transporter
MTTLIGSSTNLLVSDALTDASGGGLDFFDPLWPGVLLAGVGIFYIAVHHAEAAAPA